MLNKVLFWIAFFFAYVIQGVTGFAGNVFSMPVGTHLLGLSSSVAILNTTSALASALLAAMNLKSVNWRELGRILVVMLPFVLVGIWLDTVIELRALLRIYGAIIIAVGVYNLAFKRQRFLPAWGQFAILAAAGVVQGMFVSGGALLVIYAVQRLTDKNQFRATLSMVWLVLNVMYALIAFGAGSFTGDVWLVIAVCIPLLIVATVLGNVIQKRVSQEAFLKLTYVLILCVGAILIITA